MSSNPFSSARVRIAFLLLFILLGVGGYFATDLSKFQQRISTEEGLTALQGITNPRQVEDALRQRPSNKILQLMAKATKATDDTRRAIDRLSAEIEPARLSKEINFGSASRDDIEAFRRDLITAEANTTAFLPRYATILQTERDQIESAARSLHVPKDIAGPILNGLTQRHAKALNTISVLLSARADYYRAYEKYMAFLSSEFGSFKVVGGQFIFPLHRTVERYNAAAQAMTSAARRVTELETDMNKKNQALPEEWIQLTGAK
jgi:hypothetical protein